MENKQGTNISREELIKVIADFIEMGHIENIVAMFRQEKEHYGLCGDLISDERYMVRIGMAVLFEELYVYNPADLVLAIPALLPKLQDEKSYVRGDAATLLGIIGTEQAREALKKMLNDQDKQVVEIVKDILSAS
ncbi:MAG: HEAT repeat domain-containing protein [Pseudomonadota bacterium]